MQDRRAVAVQAAEAVEPAGGWRFKLGIATFVFAFAIWLLVPLAALMQVATGTVAALVGTLFICNKVLLVLVVAIMGKPGFQQLKRHIFAFAAALVPSEVSRSATRLVSPCSAFRSSRRSWSPMSMQSRRTCGPTAGRSSSWAI